MVSIPGFLLRKLYVRGTLENTSQGIAFRLRNTLGSGYAEKMLPVRLDGEEIPLSRCFFWSGGKKRSFDQVSRSDPFTLSLNQDIVVSVEDISLTPEPHTVGIGFRVPGFGELRFDFVDVPSSQEATGHEAT
ncbi:MAG: hypothetical protein IIC96_09390 [Chloroflexi bacterium]|nr:hypothetical protein [Chloroflexota bacterium]